MTPKRPVSPSSVTLFRSSLVLAVGAALGPACGSRNNGFSTGSDASVGDTGTDDSGDAGESDSMSIFGDSSSCTTGAACGDGGVCAGGKCCAASLACGGACCAGGQVCSFQACVTPGCAVRRLERLPRRASTASYSLGSADGGAPEAGADSSCVGGRPAGNGRCLPARRSARPTPAHPTAAPSRASSSASTTRRPRRSRPRWPTRGAAQITLALRRRRDDGAHRRAARGHQLRRQGQRARHPGHRVHLIHRRRLHDATARCTPSRCETARSSTAGPCPGRSTPPPSSRAATSTACRATRSSRCGADGNVHAFHGDGSVYWTTPARSRCAMPSDRRSRRRRPPRGGRGGRRPRRRDGRDQGRRSSLDGTVRAERHRRRRQARHRDLEPGLPRRRHALRRHDGAAASWPAIGDFDKDGKPEVVAVHYATHTVSFWHYDATQAAKFSWVRQGVDINGTARAALPRRQRGLHVGRRSADGGRLQRRRHARRRPRGRHRLHASSTAAKLIDAPRSRTPRPSCGRRPPPTAPRRRPAARSSTSTATASAEVLYSDEEHLRVYDGPDRQRHLVDVQHHRHARGVPARRRRGQRRPRRHRRRLERVRKRHRRVPVQRRHQHRAGRRARLQRPEPRLGAHALDLERARRTTSPTSTTTARCPQHELPNWTQPGLNNFRQNKQPGGEFAAPDAIVSLGAGLRHALRRSSPPCATSARRRCRRAWSSASTTGTRRTGTKLGSLTTLAAALPGRVRDGGPRR